MNRHTETHYGEEMSENQNQYKPFFHGCNDKVKIQNISWLLALFFLRHIQVITM
ncbi:MAG: hypothetical protein NTW54_05750 [Bacteroidetes bacterium]|nr:hypothetical protein [Bacteroidota bacterium]